MREPFVNFMGVFRYSGMNFFQLKIDFSNFPLSLGVCCVSVCSAPGFLPAGFSYRGCLLPLFPPSSSAAGERQLRDTGLPCQCHPLLCVQVNQPTTLSSLSLYIYHIGVSSVITALRVFLPCLSLPLPQSPGLYSCHPRHGFA